MKQAGARFLYKAKYRTDKSFTGLVLVANPKAKSLLLASGAKKRIKS